MNHSFEKADPVAGLHALAGACLKLAGSLDRLSETFAPPGKSSLEIDYGLICVARRIEELSKQATQLAAILGSIATRCGVNAQPPAAGSAAPAGPPSDPPEASEYRQPHYRPRRTR